MKISKNTIMLMAFAVMTVSPALAILFGPMYPPPGGVTWAPSGTDPGDPNGMNWNYTAFNFAAGNMSNLYWAPLESIIGISLDNGQNYSGGEILQLSADPNGASAVWTGSSPLTYRPSPGANFTAVTVETRYTVTLSGNASWITPGPPPAEIVGHNGAVAQITGDFTANLFAEANFPNLGWMPIREGFNLLETLGTIGSNFGTGFWYEPYTGFTYQGRLLADNAAADGMYDMQFMLYDDPNTLADSPVGSTIFADDVDVVDGYFITTLDFGTNAFDSRARWLQIAVRPGASSEPNDFVALSPPQPLTTTPYALHSLQTRGISVGPTLNVGIGTTTPTEKLEVNGTIKATAFVGNITGVETDPVFGASAASGISLSQITNWNTAYNWGDHSAAGYLTSYVETDPQVGVIDANSVPVWDGSSLVTGTIYDNGNVGIGTTSPTQKLEVSGTVKADSFKGVPWLSPAFHIRDANVGVRGHLDPWEQVLYFKMPHAVTIEGIIVSSDDETNGDSFSFRVGKNGSTYVNTTAVNIANLDSVRITLPAPWDFSVDERLDVKCLTGNAVAELTVIAYGRTNE